VLYIYIYVYIFYFSCESIASVKEWLKALPSEGCDAVDCGSLALDKPQIDALEKAVLDLQVLVLQ